MTAQCTRAANGAGRAGGPAPWHPAASLAVRPPGGQPGRPAAPPTHTTRPRGRRLRPAPPFCSRPSVPPPPAPPRPQRAPVPPPRAAPEEPFMPSSALRARGVPAPPSLAIPRGGPMPPPFAKDGSEKGILRDSLFRNVLCEGGGLFPFQKRPLRGGAGPAPTEAPSVTLAAIWARPCLTCRAGISLCDLWAYRRWRLAKSPASQIRPVPSPLLPRLLCGLPARHPPARPYRGQRRWPA